MKLISKLIIERLHRRYNQKREQTVNVFKWQLSSVIEVLRLRQLLLIEWNRIGAFYCFSLGVYLWPCCRRTTTPFFCVAWRQMQQLFLRQQKQLPSCNDFHLQNPPQLLPHEHGWANLSWSSGGAFPRKRGHYQRFPNWANEYALAHWTQIFFHGGMQITDTVRLRFFPEGPLSSFVVQIVKQKIDFSLQWAHLVFLSGPPAVPVIPGLSGKWRTVLVVPAEPGPDETAVSGPLPSPVPYWSW